MAAGLFAQRSSRFFGFFRRDVQTDNSIVLPETPAHGDMLPYPALMLHGGKDGGLARGEARHHRIVYGLVGVEAVDGVQVAREVFGAVHGVDSWCSRIPPTVVPGFMLVPWMATAKS